MSTFRCSRQEVSIPIFETFSKMGAALKGKKIASSVCVCVCGGGGGGGGRAGGGGILTDNSSHL